ncbi:hypothetical protein LHJ74_08685 [Streptomyces sp. N2-109]|uniref:Transposase n=1 Tax=Streptomyces gossypii TaxID=2883101 RepID=A0ABT2JQ36_9ACTN|nr:hypothetical protein [Streptomyces gossypii]MCT2589985.1 hypothetical protein [Streptomyces gossypii]
MADPHAITVPVIQLPALPPPVTEGAAALGARGLTDQHRMRLHTELIRAGVPPHPGDLRTIKALAELDESAVTSVARWIRQAARIPAALPLAPPGRPDPRIDPRLVAW